MGNVDNGVGIRDVALALGVKNNQVHAWHTRRRTTKFPEPVAYRTTPAYPGDKVGAPLFDLNEVIEWRKTFRPQRGVTKPVTRTEDDLLLQHRRYAWYGHRDADAVEGEQQYQRQRKRDRDKRRKGYAADHDPEQRRRDAPADREQDAG